MYRATFVTSISSTEVRDSTELTSACLKRRFWSSSKADTVLKSLKTAADEALMLTPIQSGDGATVGSWDGRDGSGEGGWLRVGTSDGAAVGKYVGECVGLFEGSEVG